ncbi:uncharacterized protein BO80DRAFT_384743 [Aspergillus ibericus CBS 121593]|uniref:DUF6536 domain-containing protein n=1 Tax=Aspergillus ibericus CBS 121593 TaxID=1448316 RepID=A0A395GY20_9EURO|nr:hypothetical protein BO80DRAFT_384743 [Aspergillus ibericus CBS 121593]RAK99587.1 hypothetical protein BO80DRAFT_384743 [Aspergillus ibericus CBS 121593]
MSAATIYEGSCSRAKAWTTGLHLLINVLGTIILGASSYCMQCLTAPSRTEVDRAHEERVWLHIGVASPRNLAWAGRFRVTLWLLLAASSLPIHLIYNSAVFFALGTKEYNVVLASANFDFDRPPAEYNVSYGECFEPNTAMNMSTFYADLPNFKNLTRQECLEKHLTDFPADLGTLILVTSNLTVANESLQWVDVGNPPANYEGTVAYSFEWLCDQLDVDGYCTRSRLLRAVDSWAVPWLMPWSGPVINATVDLPRGSATISGKMIELYDLKTDEWPAALISDYDSLAMKLQGFPSEYYLQQFLDNATYWQNSTWAQDVRLRATDEEACSADINFFSVSTSSTSQTAYPVEYCLSLKTAEHCELQFSPAICLVVIACNVVKFLCMLLTARCDRKDIFLTVGDAMASFLSRPDPTTERMGLLSRSNLTTGPQPWQSRRKRYWRVAAKDASQPQAWARLPPRHRWMRAVRLEQWILTISVCLMLLGVGGYMLSLAIGGLQNEGQDWSLPALWNLGFGSATPHTIIMLPHASVISMALLANCPQIVISVGYFLYNNLLTHMLLATEYDDYATQRKSLRVSWPEGNQRATYYLSLPYRYSVPLMLALMLLHWLVSASLFYVEIIPFDTQGNPSYAYQVIACGYAPIAIIFALVLGVVMTSTIVGMSMKRFDSRMPIASSCSAAISAACHPQGGDEHALKPVMWGEIPMSSTKAGVSVDIESLSDTESDDGDLGRGTRVRGERWRERYYPPLDRESAGQDGTYGHCSFTSEEVTTPDPSRLYI